ICRRGIADELSGTRLWTIVRSHQGSRRWSSGHPPSSRRRTVGLSRASPDCESGARADWFGYELRCRCRSRTPSNPAGKGGVRHQPDGSRHAVCAVSPGDGHYLGRDGDAETVRGCTRRGPKRPTTASCARPAVSTAAGILWRTTMISQLHPIKEFIGGNRRHYSVALATENCPRYHLRGRGSMAPAESVTLGQARQSNQRSFLECLDACRHRVGMAPLQSLWVSAASVHHRCILHPQSSTKMGYHNSSIVIGSS